MTNQEKLQAEKQKVQNLLETNGYKEMIILFRTQGSDIGLYQTSQPGHGTKFFDKIMLSTQSELEKLLTAGQHPDKN